MTDVVSDGRLKLLQVTLTAGFVSMGAFMVSAAFLQDDALLYLLLALAVASFASPFLGLQKRLVNYVAARRGTTYVTFGILLLPVGLIANSAFVAYFLWLGVSSGILDIEGYFIPITGLIIAILINTAILVYNVVKIRGID